MRITQPEPVTRLYCDKCGKDITRETRYIQDGKEYCGLHCPWTLKDLRKKWAVDKIKEQPFFYLQRIKG